MELDDAWLLRRRWGLGFSTLRSRRRRSGQLRNTANGEERPTVLVTKLSPDFVFKQLHHLADSVGREVGFRQLDAAGFWVSQAVIKVSLGRGHLRLNVGVEPASEFSRWLLAGDQDSLSLSLPQLLTPFMGLYMCYS